MKVLQRPIRATILFGLICGFAFIPLNIVLNYLIFRSTATCLILWLFSVGYAFLLIRWSNKKIISGVFPLLLLFLSVFLVKSIFAFFLFAIAVISWIRSGICFQRRGVLKQVVEIMLCFVSGILSAVFTPNSVFTWMLAVWMFFLIQALYFVFIEHARSPEEETIEMDPFERASRQAETILWKASF